jgi:hypothetical protein
MAEIDRPRAVPFLREGLERSSIDAFPGTWMVYQENAEDGDEEFEETGKQTTQARFMEMIDRPKETFSITNRSRTVSIRTPFELIRQMGTINELKILRKPNN